MSDSVTPEQSRALEIAREMARAGIPVFACPPNPFKPGKYYFKADWQNTPADPATVDQWQPGWGIAAVGGHAADFLDMDPRSGGIESQTELKNAGQWPLSFGQQSTPSGGTHDVISSSGERKETAFMPGLDFQAGAPEPDETGSHGRAFIWIAPTVGLSKVTGELVAYRWVQPPDLTALSEWQLPGGGTSDSSIEGIVARVYAKRATKTKPAVSDAPVTGKSQLFGTAHDPFTKADAEKFLAPLYDRLIAAKIGDIEEAGMAFTLGIEHFVPAFWSAEQAFAIVMEALKSTAYDPNGPSDWTADKFLARLDGRRPVPGSWKAERKVEPAEAAAAFGHAEQATAVPTSEEAAQDLITVMLDRMLSPEQMMALPPPQPLIEGLLDLDSLCWIIGAPGSFKSFVSLDLAAHVGSGLPWRDMEVTQGPVVYIAAEGTRGMGKRIKAWRKKYGPMGDVRFLPMPIKIKDVVAWQTLVEACRQVRPVMVVIDTQARVTAGVEENSNTEMGVAIEAFDAIKRATAACVLVVHHTGRNGQDARGASAIDGAQDTELKLERQQPRSSMIVKLKEDKQKDMGETEGGILLKLVEEVVSEAGEKRLTSLRLGDRWEEIQGVEMEIDVEPWKGREPGDWTKRYVAYNSKWQRRILQVLFDHAETAGLSEAKVRETVVARWKEKPEVDTWNDAWPKVITKEIQGEPLTVAAGARRYVNTVIREQIEMSESS